MITRDLLRSYAMIADAYTIRNSVARPVLNSSKAACVYLPYCGEFLVAIIMHGLARPSHATALWNLTCDQNVEYDKNGWKKRLFFSRFSERGIRPPFRCQLYA